MGRKGGERYVYPKTFNYSCYQSFLVKRFLSVFFGRSLKVLLLNNQGKWSKIVITFFFMYMYAVLSAQVCISALNSLSCATLSFENPDVHTHCIRVS